MKAQIFHYNHSGAVNGHACSDYIAEKMFLLGGQTDLSAVVSSDHFTLTKSDLEKSDVTFLLLPELIEESTAIKQKIAEVFSDTLFDSSFAQNFVDNYYQKYAKKKEKSSANFALMPRSARCLTTEHSAMQGFVLERDNHFCFCLPNNLDAIKEIWEKQIQVLLTENFKNVRAYTVLKSFGLSKEKILERTNDLLSNKNQIRLMIMEENLDCKLVVSYSKRTEEETVSRFVGAIKDEIKGYIYSEIEETLSHTVFKLLQKNKLTLAVAESITGGEIVNLLVKENPGVSDYLLEGVVTYTNESKINRLKVNPETLNKFTAVSPETAYEMAAGLLQTSQADFVISTCGYAQLDKENAGTAYIGIGNMKSIHIYKTDCSGTRQEVIKTVALSALFHLLKNLEILLKK